MNATHQRVCTSKFDVTTVLKVTNTDSIFQTFYCAHIIILGLLNMKASIRLTKNISYIITYDYNIRNVNDFLHYKPTLYWLTRFSTKILVIRLANGGRAVGRAAGRILNGVKLWRQTVVSAQ